MKWINITVQDMLHLYGVMLQTYIDPHNIGGYTSYFESIWIFFYGKGYTVSLEAYEGWDSKIMSISRFRLIWSEYHPDFGEYAVGDKYYQQIFMVRCINLSDARTLDLDTNVDFYGGGIVICSRFCCVRKYNKDKQEKSEFISMYCLTESTTFFGISTCTRGVTQ